MRTLLPGLLATALALAGAALLPLPAHGAPAGVSHSVTATDGAAIAPASYSLSNGATGKRLHVSGVALAAGTKIVQEAARATAGQSWWIGQVSPGVHFLRNTNSGLCLQDAAAAGGVLTQAACADVPAQRFTLPESGGTVTLVNVGSGRAASGAAGTDILSQPRDESAAQRWSLAANTLSRVSAWGTALTDGGPALSNKTIRMVVRPNLAGNAQRLTLSNRFGTTPLVIGAATVGRQGAGLGAAAAPGVVKFAGQGSVTIPAGGEITSDALNVPVTPTTNLLVSLFVSGTVPVSTFHSLGLASHGMADGNHATEQGAGSFTQASSQFYFLKSIDVITATAAGTLVALGDSITDGWGSTNNGFDNWPAQLADHVNARDGALALVNAGISSNRVTYDAGNAKSRGMAATTRFGYDVAAVPGVNAVFLFEGINDIPDGASSERLIAGYRTLIAAARAAGLRIYGATLTPTKGTSSFTPARELVRTTTNAWILGSGEFDAVVDFSAAVADPADPQRLLPVYDSGDRIHLSSAGYAALAAAADAVLFPAGP